MTSDRCQYDVPETSRPGPRPGPARLTVRPERVLDQRASRDDAPLDREADSGEPRDPGSGSGSQQDGTARRPAPERRPPQAHSWIRANGCASSSS